ncbi:alpha/beta fold hydrolase [Stenotrophomonas sp. MYb238]|uniref:alpha/beta hydrolase family protein n=1 Tax=Stenotrophomonas sp. MYb238 TaxID=2040281 RepID=UPI00129296ED|nr:alpha/beta fold hydrolase [Stenotrophomonas sp. MYb238]MQP74874.1 alpha/beta fold hydrolase [Stenotrophomonas sp. MYb238]
MNTHSVLDVVAADGHRFELLAQVPSRPVAAVLWLPALGVAARHYLPLAEALAARGVAVFVHEWRGNGSSSLRADRNHDWGYRELLQHDIPAAEAAARAAAPGIPLRLGGHSLGGQLACCHAGLHPDAFAGLWLVASGTPWWHGFPAPRRWLLPLAYRFLPWLAQRRGALPGRRLGFGGTEARGLIRDWARVGLGGRYAAAGLPVDLEAAMGALTLPVEALLFDADWLAPAGSMRHLLSKLPAAPATLRILTAAELGTRADHFSWMKSPAIVADALTSPASQEFSQKR